MSPLGRHLTCALFAGGLGSLIGSLASVPYLIVISTWRSDVETMISIGYGTVLVMMVFASLIFTLPSALLLAAPLIWRFRSWAADQPWLAGLVFGATGALAGLAMASTTADRLNALMLLGGIYGFATGASFIAAIRSMTPRPEPSDPLETIFD